MPPGFSGFVEPGLSFSPEKTQIELACDVAASFGVRLPGGPITSLAKAALALAPARAAVQTATASNDFLRIASSHLGTPRGLASIARFVIDAPVFRSSGANYIAHVVSLLGRRSARWEAFGPQSGQDQDARHLRLGSRKGSGRRVSNPRPSAWEARGLLHARAKWMADVARM
jgi:hypothetical protein